jgi:hypothetical protein
MEFHDFQIRSWTINNNSAAVLVHSSPAGAMQKPETVELNWERLFSFRKIFQKPPAKVTPDQLTEAGQELARIIFPDTVLDLLMRSISCLEPEDGLRVRLCLDGALLELPWEYLVLPDTAGLTTPGGFLAADSRISIVREPPLPGRHRAILKKKQRLLFFGARLFSESGEDLWKIAEERDKLFKALEPASSHLETLSVLSDETDCQTALMMSKVPVDIFHYSGHTNIENSEAYLVAHDVKGDWQNVDKLSARALGSLLRQAGTTIAVFSACNSGNWAFVEPLLRAGIPVVVGAQGAVFVDVAIVFCTRLYSALAIGLSLDEAVTWARMCLLEPDVLSESLKWQWGAFMVYMQTPEALLFPKPRETGIRERQNAMRRERQQTIINVYQNIGSVINSKVIGYSGNTDKVQVNNKLTGKSDNMGEIQNTKIMKKNLLKYRDFNLRFAYYSVKDGTYKVWVEGEAPGGSMSPNDAVTLDYDPKVFWNDPVLGTGGLLGKLDRRNLGKDGLFELGRLLADLALPEKKVRPLLEKSIIALNENEGLRIRLRIDAPELAELPWEFIMLPQTSGEPQDSDFLILRREISIVRTDTVESATRKLPDRIPRIVGVFSRPNDQDNINVDKDKDALEKAIKSFKQATGQETISVRYVEKPATREKLAEALRDGAEVFQYSGHATFELNNVGKLVLEDKDNRSDPYLASQLAELISGAGVRLAILNACETGRRNGRMRWSGVAPALTRQNVPAIVANQFDIFDTSAILMAAIIYPRLLSGYTIDEALMEARRTIYQQKEGLEIRDWGVPVLYLRDETGVLFQLPEEDEAKEMEEKAPFILVARKLNKVAGKSTEALVADINKLKGVRLEVRTEIEDVTGEAIGIEIK